MGKEILNKKDICLKIIELLKVEYPVAECTLRYKKDYQLLIATRLAAQCTDKRVNTVTDVLFKKFKTLDSLANADIVDVENIIKPCGFYKIKAKDIVNMCNLLISNFSSKVPNNIKDLVSLPGVGRKTANLILGDIYNLPAVVVDTHCIRITRRIGLHDSKNPILVEKILKDILPPEESNDFCHRLVMHGREICKALKPKCEICCINGVCSKKFENKI